MTRRALVVAPHADDEVLGVGGTLARLAAEGVETHVVIMTQGYPPLFSEEEERETVRQVREAHRLLGVADATLLALPAAGLDTVPHSDVNAALGAVLRRVQPHTLFVPFPGDIHLDHQRAFLSALVAARPGGGGAPCVIYAYETVSETNWNAPYLTPNFTPNVFVDISGYLDRKIEAMQAVASQIKPFPHERSAEALRALATLRGSTVGCHAAEAFVLVRQLV